MPTPVRIIQPRAKTPPCCGGQFVHAELLFGSGSVPPCTPTTIDLITDGTFDNPAAWPFQSGGNPQQGGIVGGQLTWPDIPSFIVFDDAYFQAIPSLVSTRDHTLTITKTDTGIDPPPIVFLIFQSSDGFYTFHNLSGVNGTDTIVITAGAPFWTAGGEGAYFPHFGLSPTDYGVLIVLQNSAADRGGGFLDDFSFTYEDCI